MKYNKSKIMKRAWELVKKSALAISEGLRQAWAEAKAPVKFKNGMRIQVGSAYYDLRRWTKYGNDRVYINDSTRKGAGYVDLNTMEFLGGNAWLATPNLDKAAKIILAMEF